MPLRTSLQVPWGGLLRGEGSVAPLGVGAEPYQSLGVGVGTSPATTSPVAAGVTLSPLHRGLDRDPVLSSEWGPLWRSSLDPGGREAW